MQKGFQTTLGRNELCELTFNQPVGQMKKYTLVLSTMILLTSMLSGCVVVEGIFKAGMIWGIILVFLVIFGLLYLFTRGRNK